MLQQVARDAPPRDITPNVIIELAKVEIPGVGELLRHAGAAHVPTAWLSRSLAAIVEDTLVIALPGSPGAVKDSVEVLKTILSHALDRMKKVNV